MAYCGPAGVAYTDFLTWDALSRDLAIAWRQQEDSRCSGCGVPMGDWYLEDGTPDDRAYKAELYRCPGCSELGSVETDAKDPGLLKRLAPNWLALRWRNYGRG